MFERSQRNGGGERRSRWRRAAALVLIAGGAAGCDSIFEVDNPNDLVQEDLEQPASSTALVNGAEATVARGLNDIVLAISVPTDELTWRGTYDAGRELDAGFLSNPANEFSNAEAWSTFAEGRFMADEAVRLMEQWQAEGVLPDSSHLARAYLYSAIAYVAAADYWDAFVISDRREAAPPLAEDEMSQLYDIAIDRLGKGLAVARGIGDSDLEAAILGMRARAHFAKAIWQKLNPPGATPADPLVDDAAAAADALAALDLVDGDWKFQFEYGPTTVSSQLGSWINSRQEFRVDTAYAVPNEAGSRVIGVALLDPIDLAPDSALYRALDELGALSSTTEEYPPFTVVSARELHLIAAEVALAGGLDADAAAHINAVRALDERTPYSGQVPLLDLLIHERRVNLFLQGRRLADMYRFGITDPRWQQTSDAATRPGTFFPIADEEIKSNCYVSGIC
ncbi:MAG TPA: RagB/SusD family nutrient uptake outer membrane protein [Longimicrobiales bacterium]